MDRLAISMEKGEPLYSRNSVADEKTGDIWELEGSPQAGYRISNKRSRGCPLYWKDNRLACHAPHARPVPAEDEMRWFFEIVPKKKIAEKIEKAKDEGLGATQDAEDGLATFLYSARFPMRSVGVVGGRLRAPESPWVTPD